MKLKHIEKLVKNAFLSYRFLKYYLSGLNIRDEKLWVFGTYNQGFSDNTKYLYLFVKEHYPDIKAIWISRNKDICAFLNEQGIESYWQKSKKAQYFLKKAKYHFTNTNLTDTDYWSSRGAIYVNLWHGLALKKIEFDIKTGSIAWKYHSSYFLSSFLKKLSFPALYKKPDFIIACSEASAKTFKSSFRLNDDNLIYAPLARNSIFNADKPKLKNYIERFEKKEDASILDNISRYNKVFVYLPTFRDGKKDFLNESGINFKLWNDFLKEHNFLLIVKLHPNLNNICAPQSNLIFLSSKVDIYPFLPFTDCLISDYSSVFIDYLLLDKNIIFYCYDKHTYITSTRGLYYDYNDVSPGDKCYNFNELMNSMKNCNNDKYSKQRAKIRDFFWDKSYNTDLHTIIKEICSKG